MTLAERLPLNGSLNGKRVEIGLFAVALAAGAALFWEAIGDLFYRWGLQEELSHSYFIPVISAWLVWENREKVRASVGEPSIVGVLIGVGAVLLMLVGRLIESFLFQQLALVAAIAGATAAFGGTSLLRTTAAPIAFLLFAVPPPFMLINILSWKFQEMSSILGVAMLQALNVPVFLSGNIIDLGDHKLQVAEACSGLRYLFPFLSLGVMAAYIARTPLWGKAIIVLSTIPITIFMNSFRIAATGWLVQRSDLSHTEGVLHWFEGWVVFLLCLAALFGVISALGALSRPRMSAFDMLGSPELPATSPSRGGKGALAAMGGLAATLIAGVGLSSAVGVDNLIVPERTKFAQLPGEFSGWRAEVREIEEVVFEAIGADDTIVVDMVRPDGELVNLYLAYLEARRDGRSWHSPQQCLPGGGWGISRHTVEKTTTPDGRPLNYNRLVIENGRYKQLVYYWYPQRGRNIANELVMRGWLTFDSLSRRRSDGAMVRLLAPVKEEDGIEAAEAVLQSTMQDLLEVLPAYVPN